MYRYRTILHISIKYIIHVNEKIPSFSTLVLKHKKDVTIVSFQVINSTICNIFYATSYGVYIFSVYLVHVHTTGTLITEVWFLHKKMLHRGNKDIRKKVLLQNLSTFKVNSKRGKPLKWTKSSLIKKKKDGNRHIISLTIFTRQWLRSNALARMKFYGHYHILVDRYDVLVSCQCVGVTINMCFALLDL